VYKKNKMKKVFFYLVLCLAFSAGSFAQGIEFHKGDWASVKAKAKQENKLIFIDFYTSWCGPCKYMAKNIFPLPEVGEFYNSNFINYKVDAEKGEGVALAEKYSVKGYPTLLFVDHEGTFVHQNGGGLGVERFIELGKTALNPNERYGSIDYEKLDENTDLSEVPGRILKLKDEMMPFNDLYRKYLNTIPKKELYSKKTFDLMETVGMKRTSSYTYSFVYQNKKDFEKAVGKSAVDRFFYNVYMSETFSLINNKQPTDPIYEQMGKDGFTFSNKVKEAVDISFYAYQQRPEKFVVAAR
jgi:thiol-disulfide isomerase/thioredoxin